MERATEKTESIHSNLARPISKTEFLAGVQCAKLLWFQYNHPEVFPPVSAIMQDAFDQGHEVERLARTMYPGGREIPGGWQEMEHDALMETGAALFERRPLFEAAFAFAGGFSRVDILNPIDSDEWELVKVKSGVEVKEVHLLDIAFQRYNLQANGVKVRRCALMHLDRNYVRQADLDCGRLFLRQDISAEVAKILPSIKGNLAGLLQTVSQTACPEMQIDTHCYDPFAWPLRDRCWEFLPQHNVVELYRGKRRAFDLLHRDYKKIADIPEVESLTKQQQIQKKVILEDRAHIEKLAIEQFLKKIQFPAYFLDFEAFQMALPPYDGTRTWQQIPFQFSASQC